MPKTEEIKLSVWQKMKIDTLEGINKKTDPAPKKNYLSKSNFWVTRPRGLHPLENGPLGIIIEINWATVKI